MTERERGTKVSFVDPDDAPELTEDWFEQADLHDGEKLVRRGRPRSEFPKEHVNIRLSTEVVDYFRAGGPGWQTRLNETLLSWVKRAKA